MRIRCHFRAATVLVPTLLALVIAAPALGADRVVLFEDFTATWCGPCAYAGRALNLLEDNYPDDVVIVQIHVSDSYTTAFGDDRAIKYGVSGIPHVTADGTENLIGVYGNDSQDYNRYRTVMLNHQAVATDLSISLDVQHVENETTFEVTATVTNDSPTETYDVRVRLMQVLDHYPTGTHYMNCFRQASGLGSVYVLPGGFDTYTAQFTLASLDASRKDDVRFLGLVRDLGIVPKPVHNAAIVDCPLPPYDVLGDLDGDLDVDFDDLNILLAHYGDAPAHPEDGDLDDDNDVDFDDLNILLAAYGT